MDNRDLELQLEKIEALFDRTDKACGGDDFLRAHWGKYLCVLAAGFLENALATIYIDFTKRASSGPVTNFASSTLDKIQNPKTARFVEVTQQFKPAWAASLESFVQQEGRREAIDSIMAHRHLIAHGQTSGITVARVHEYLEKAIDVVEFLQDEIKK